MDNSPTLYIFAGLPGAGKSTLAKRLSEHLGCAFLRIDTIEQGLREVCGISVEGEGYRLAYRIAADNLRLGQSVVADSCNPIELTRVEWRAVAESTGQAAIDIEVVCSDAAEHQRRVEERPSEVAGLVMPTWHDVVNREYDSWQTKRIVVDTAGSDEEQSFSELITRLGERS